MTRFLNRRRQRRRYREILAAVESGEHLPGSVYLGASWHQHDETRRQTLRRVPKLGKVAPKTYAALGEMLAWVDLLGSCFWGCSEDDHTIQYLIGSAGSTCEAAVFLALGGRYDAGLAMIRNAGERANLLALFAIDSSALIAWRAMDPRARRRHYGPAAVRRTLDETHDTWPITDERYDELSGITHPHDAKPPQAFNPLQIPVTAQVYQEAGFLVTLNEAALVAGVVGGFGAMALSSTIGKADAKRVLLASADLLESIGGVTITDLNNLWQEVRSK